MRSILGHFWDCSECTHTPIIMPLLSEYAKSPQQLQPKKGGSTQYCRLARLLRFHFLKITIMLHWKIIAAVNIHSSMYDARPVKHIRFICLLSHMLKIEHLFWGYVVPLQRFCVKNELYSKMLQLKQDKRAALPVWFTNFVSQNKCTA